MAQLSNLLRASTNRQTSPNYRREWGPTGFRNGRNDQDWSYNPKDLTNREERNRKEKEVLAEELQKKKRVNEEETAEFIKTLKMSEYSVMEQLKKLPAQISIMSLLLSTETHRNLLLKFLNEFYVPEGIAIETLNT